MLPRIAALPATVFAVGIATVGDTGVGSLDYTIVAVALVAAFPATLAALLARSAANSAATKANAAKSEIAEARSNLIEIKLSVDGFMEKYSLARDEAARAGGIADERQAGLERAADAAVAVAVVAQDQAAIQQAEAEARTPAGIPNPGEHVDLSNPTPVIVVDQIEPVPVIVEEKPSA